MALGAAVALGAAGAARGADEHDHPTYVLGGYIDTTFNYNLNGADNNAFHSYDNKANTFLLNSADLQLAGTVEKNLSYFIQIDAGSDAARNSADNIAVSSGADDFDIQEAYITYAFGDTGFGFKAGKFVTLEGIEVIESMLNPTITRGFLFGLAEPFTHVGALGTYTPPSLKDWTFTLGLVNGWDILEDNNNSKTIVAAAAYSMGDPLWIQAVLMSGPEKPGNNSDNRMSFDVTATNKSVKNLVLSGQFNYGSEENSAVGGGDATWIGFGAQAVYSFDGTPWNVGGRFEIFDDKDGARTGVDDTRLVNFSVAPGYTLTKNLVTRVELRVDQSNNDVFADGHVLNDKKQQVEVAAELYYTF
jgi:hypothetical protein